MEVELVVCAMCESRGRRRPARFLWDDVEQLPMFCFDCAAVAYGMLAARGDQRAASMRDDIMRVVRKLAVLPGGKPQDIEWAESELDRAVKLVKDNPL